jgi:hypothetical protein
LTLSISAGLSESVRRTTVIEAAGFTLEMTGSILPAYVCTDPPSGLVFDAVRNRVVDPAVARQVNTSKRQANPAFIPTVRIFMGHPSGPVTEVAYDNTLVSFAGGLQLLPELRQFQSNLRHLADGVIRDISLTSDFIIARNSPQVGTAQELGSAVSTVALGERTPVHLGNTWTLRSEQSLRDFL